MGLIQFFRNRNRIHKAGKVGKIETEIEKYQSIQFKDDSDWKKLSKLRQKKAEIIESNKIKSETSNVSKITNNSFGLNYKGYQQVNSNQNNKASSKTSSKSRKKK